MKTQELLNKLRSEVDVIVDIAQNDFYNLTDAQLNWKENSERWSILECFEHLNRYSRYYYTAMSNGMEKTKQALQSNTELRSTWMGAKSIQMMHPSNKKKQKTFKNMNPANSTLNRSVLNEFLKHQESIKLLLTKAEQVDINSIKIPLEFFKLLKITLGETLEFLVVHEQRHLIQAQQVRGKILETKSPALAI